MTVDPLPRRPRPLRFLAGAALATLALAALSARASAVSEGGVRPSFDAVRLAAVAACALGAFTTRRRAAADSTAFLAAAGSVALAIVADRAILALLAGAADAPARLVSLRAAAPFVVFSAPLAFVVARLRLPVAGLLRFPARRPALAVVGGAVAGALAEPALALVQVGAGSLASAALGRADDAAAWPGAAAALARAPFSGTSSAEPGLLAVAFAGFFPLYEAFAHGALRHATLRWNPYAAAAFTALLAAFAFGNANVSAFAFGGALVTGRLAAATESVWPGFAFWPGTLLGWIACRALVPGP